MTWDRSPACRKLVIDMVFVVLMLDSVSSVQKGFITLKKSLGQE